LARRLIGIGDSIARQSSRHKLISDKYILNTDHFNGIPSLSGQPRRDGVVAMLHDRPTRMHKACLAGRKVDPRLRNR
jgi:hypothetical protein